MSDTDTSARSVATFTLTSNGKVVSGKLQVLSLTISTELNRIPAALITVLDGEASRQTFAASNAPDFAPGAELEIALGHQGKDDTVFKGIVIRHSIKVRTHASVMVVEARDKAARMTTHPRSRYFHDMKDSAVIEELLRSHQLDGDVAATGVQHEQLVQYRCTDWDFMLCRADVNGLVCIVEDGKVRVAKPDGSKARSMVLAYGNGIKDLDCEIDARDQFVGVSAVGWNPADQTLVPGVVADDPPVPRVGNLSAEALAGVTGSKPLELCHGGRDTEAELRAWANANLLKQRLGKVRGVARIEGNANVKPGHWVELQGAGERFEGKLLVSGVRHELQNGTWDTVVQLGLAPRAFAERFDVAERAAGSMLAPVHGLQFGVVTQIEKDPRGEDRIMVRVPAIHASDDGSWARLATADAGAGRGTVLRPEIGDEVVVGFVNADPRCAVVLGSLPSSAHASPIPPSDKNDQKGLKSRSGIRVLIDDDKKSLLLETPGGNSIRISDDDQGITIKDQNGNKLVMGSQGIQIESAKDLALKASANLKAVGSATAEVSSSGNTTIKGAMVAIN